MLYWVGGASPLVCHTAGGPAIAMATFPPGQLKAFRPDHRELLQCAGAPAFVIAHELHPRQWAVLRQSAGFGLGLVLAMFGAPFFDGGKSSDF